MSPLQEIFHLPPAEEKWLPRAELAKEAESLLGEYLEALQDSPSFLKALGKCWQDSQWSWAFGTTISQPIHVGKENFNYIIGLHQDNSERTLWIIKETVNGGKATSKESVEIRLCLATKERAMEKTTEILYYKHLLPLRVPYPFSMNSHATIDEAKIFLQRMKEDLSTPQTK